MLDCLIIHINDTMDERIASFNGIQYDLHSMTNLYSFGTDFEQLN
ncbi:hypothetical protein HPL003_25915 [Paenibacillus terrae HPL-003]|uniref:Uncharacterized protein n=1 Tax=Paenibacillus terrae (strain HPL-003) TaxID=985665 RepID=G7VQR9_PAETH|nr:hypothetical protein HPL003_25915 [Paenibacillus terrae HPL-003]